MTLTDFGWDEDWAERLAAADRESGRPARVLAQHRGLYRVHTGEDELSARSAGALRHAAGTVAAIPAVGDWVVIDSGGQDREAIIRTVLPRRSVFSRKVPGRQTEEQVVGANVDIAWIVSPVGAERNAARLERYLTLVWESGASPVVVLTKADLSPSAASSAASLGERLIGTPIYVVSAVEGYGLDELRKILVPGRTIVLLGASGVGKSTLINCLAGRKVMRTAEVRASDGKGRHTTRHRQLVLLPGGGLLLDTPGMRELSPWSADEGLERSFADIERLALGCRFGDCRHDSEPGCAVKEAVASGELAEGRLVSFKKLVKELDYVERRRDVRADLEERQRWKTITKEYRRWKKRNR